MLEKETFMEKVKNGIPLLTGITLAIGCLLGIVMIVVLLKLATEVG